MSALALQDMDRIIADLGAPVISEVSPDTRPNSRSQFQGLPQRTDIPALNIETVNSALAHIPADVPRGNGSIMAPDGSPPDNYWFGVILALRREFGAAGQSLARDWSKRSDRYTEEGFNQAWDAFDPDHANPVTIGSVMALARAFGWSGHSHAAQLAPRVGRYQLLNRTSIIALQPIQWRVKGIFPQAGIGVIFGASGSGKSFLVLDMGLRIASGEPWFGHRTTECPVTYVMLEGEAGLHNRVVAWEMQNGEPVPSGFAGVPQPFSLTDPQDVA